MLKKKFFSTEEEGIVVKAIADAETKTTGEIRVHIDSFCFGNPFEKAKKVFLKLNMQNTKQRNGVLIYIAIFNKKIAIVGDAGISTKVLPNFWDVIIKDLTANFRTNRASTLAKNIAICGEQLSFYFPIENNDKNELDNSISYK